jgi:DNA helicase-2/ATP-dependent DNA helicase PcrA
MIAAVETGIYPSYRAEDTAEERFVRYQAYPCIALMLEVKRRLLYVACTRAQGLLCLSHASKHMVGSTTLRRTPSEFISFALKPTGAARVLVQSEAQRTFSADQLRSLASVIRRSDVACSAAVAKIAAQQYV